MKYYEILPTHAETPRNTTRKIANLYIEFNYHFFTLQKNIPLLLNRSVDTVSLSTGPVHSKFLKKTLVHTAEHSYANFQASTREKTEMKQHGIPAYFLGTVHACTLIRVS